jgi:hypothetical protein
VCGYPIQEFLQRWLAMGRVAAEPVKIFYALNFAAKAVHVRICGSVRDNQDEIHIRDGFHPAADCGAAEKNYTH